MKYKKRAGFLWGVGGAGKVLSEGRNHLVNETKNKTKQKIPETLIL